MQQVFLGGGEDVGREEYNIAPLRSPYKPSASEPVTASSNFSNPSISKCYASLSNCCTSLHSELAHFSKFSPCKIKGKKGNEGVALQKVAGDTRKEGRLVLPQPKAPMSLLLA